MNIIIDMNEKERLCNAVRIVLSHIQIAIHPTCINKGHNYIPLLVSVHYVICLV